MPGVITAQHTGLGGKGLTDGAHLRMQRRGLDHVWPRRVVQVEMDGVIAAILAITLVRRRQNPGRALEARHQNGGTNILQRVDDGFRSPFDVTEAA